MLKHSILNKSVAYSIAAFSIVLGASCGSQKSYVLPRAVNTACAVNIHDLNLSSGDYQVLNTVTEKASIVCKFNDNEIIVDSGDGRYSYKFKFDSNKGWRLDSFRGVATFGYLYKDILDSNKSGNGPDVEEFARLGATAKLIDAMKDYEADGVVEPVVSTRISEVGKNTYEYSCTVKAKLVIIKPSK